MDQRRKQMNGFDKSQWFWTGRKLLFVGLTDELVNDYKEQSEHSMFSSAPYRHTIIDVDNTKIYHMADWVDGAGIVTKYSTITTILSSLQEFLDTNTDTFDEIIIDGIFDKWKYSYRQYDFLFTMINSCLQIVNDGVSIRLNLDRWENEYNIHYLVTYFLNTYSHVGVEKLSDNRYIFTFNKD